MVPSTCLPKICWVVSKRKDVEQSTMFKENIINLTSGTIIKMRASRIDIFIQCRMELNVGLPSPMQTRTWWNSPTLLLQSICKEYLNHLLGLTLSTPGLVDNFFLGQNQFLQFSKGVLFLPSQRVKPTFTLESLALQRDQTFSNF